MARQRWARDRRDEDQCCTPPLWFCSLSSWWSLATSAVCSAGCEQLRSPGAHPAGSTTGMVPRGRGFTGTSSGSTLKCFVLGSLVQHSRSVYGCASLIHKYCSVHFLIIFVGLFNLLFPEAACSPRSERDGNLCITVFVLLLLKMD